MYFVVAYTLLNSGPIVCAQQLFNHCVLDLTWSPDGYNLFASSHDGSVAMLQFDKSELGVPASHTEVESMLSKYEVTERNIIPESVEQLMLEAKRVDENVGVHVENTMMERMGSEHMDQENHIMNEMPFPAPLMNNKTVAIIVPDVSMAQPATPQKQKESITKDGRKRIQPIFLQSPSRNAVQVQKRKIEVVDDPQSAVNPTVTSY